MSGTTALPRGRMSNLQLRTLTAAIGIPVLALVVWLGGWPFAIVAAVVALLATAEFIHGWLFPSLPVLAILRQPALIAAPAVAVIGAHIEPRIALVAIGAAVLLGAPGYLPTRAFGPRRPYRVQAGALLYVGVLLATFVLLRDADKGLEWVLLAVAATFAVDTGAYATGKLFGRHKLAPRISPGKTWEGAVGGYIAGAGAAFALNELLDTGIPASTLVHLALALPIVAQAGDLFESWMKRRMGVKDASGLLPGHGGFLDRLDSLMPVMALTYLFVQLRVQ